MCMKNVSGGARMWTWMGMEWKCSGGEWQCGPLDQEAGSARPARSVFTQKPDVQQWDTAIESVFFICGVGKQKWIRKCCVSALPTLSRPILGEGGIINFYDRVKNLWWRFIAKGVVEKSIWLKIAAPCVICVIPPIPSFSHYPVSIRKCEKGTIFRFNFIIPIFRFIKNVTGISSTRFIVSINKEHPLNK